MIQIYENYTPGYSDGFKVQGESSPQDIYLWDYTMDLQDRKPLHQYTPFYVYEKTEEEKYEYLDTMANTEMKIIGIRDDAEAFYNKELYSYKFNYYYVALNELRCAYDFMEEYNALDMVVFEDAILKYIQG